MKLVYLAQIGVLDNWGHTVQIMKMCEAFADNGVEVTLLVPKRKSNIKADPFEMYNVNKNFKIHQVPYIDIYQGTTSRLLYWVRFLSFLISARVNLMFNKYDILYTREVFASPFFKNSFIELHSFPKNLNFFYKFTLGKVSGIVVLTTFIKARIVELGLRSERIFVSADAVSLEDFKSISGVDEAREVLKIAKEDYLFGYLGTLKTMGMEKGVGTAIDALEFLQPRFKLYVAGGEIEDIEYYKKYANDKHLYDRVIFAGKISIKDRPLHTSVCNIMVAPFPANEHYSFYMSPLKIFEYMVSRRPIIVTNLPTLKEILVDLETALFVEPSNPKELAEAIIKLSSDISLYETLAENAYNKAVNEYTWVIRARNILNFIEQ